MDEHPKSGSRPSRTVSGILIASLSVWNALTISAIAVIGWFSPNLVVRAVILMGASLAFVWIGIGGLASRLYRNRIRNLVLSVRWPWQVKFVLMATGLALLEEVVTVSLTNLAPLFGTPVGTAYITASANYLDVVALHSVVAFVPMFIGWAWMLGRWDFHPNAVFLLFGLTGLTAEIQFGGIQQIAQFGFWIMIYGLMVYLPAYSLPADRPVRKPAWWVYPAAVFIPVAFAIPVAIIIGVFHPVKIHFPPMDSTH